MAKRVSEQILKDAWIGDAVLALYARQRVLTQTGAIDSQSVERMSSNQFLASLGEPSHVEAEIGRIYAASGLQASFAWIERTLLPLVEKQEAKRVRGLSRPG